MLNPWKILGVNRQSEDGEVRAAFLDIARTCHPDQRKEPDVNRFAEASEAYRLLTNRKERSLFLKSIVIRNKECGKCKGEGVIYKAKGLVCRKTETCDNCSGAGVLFNEQATSNRRSNKRYSR